MIKRKNAHKLREIINRNVNYKRKGWFAKYFDKGYFISDYCKNHIDVLSNTMENIVEVLEKCYKENWAFEFYNINNLPDILIRYPIITITNSKEESHVIRDLFVRIHMYYDQKGGKICIESDIEGFRLTVTREEFISGYSHSHLCHSGSNFNDFYTEGRIKQRTFCLGTNEVPEVISVFNVTQEMGTFELLLLTIDNMMKWESLEGGPHFKMRNISNKVSGERRYIPHDNEHIDIVTGILVDSTMLKECEYDMQDRIIKIVEDDTFHRNLIRIIKEVSPNSLCIRNGDYYFKSRVVTESLEPLQVSFPFKESVINFKIYSNYLDKESQDSSENLNVHPEVYKNIIKNLNKELYEKCIRFYATNREDTSLHTRRRN